MAMVTADQLAELVTSVPLFQSIADASAVSALVAALSPQNYTEGELIVKKGVQSGEMVSSWCTPTTYI